LEREKFFLLAAYWKSNIEKEEARHFFSRHCFPACDLETRGRKKMTTRFPRGEAVAI
jgi:hypothetical protein